MYDKINIQNKFHAQKELCMKNINYISRRKALSTFAMLTSSVLLGGCSLTSGFVDSEAHYAAGVSPHAINVVKTVKSQLGVRYTLGGTKPSTGFDCSGLIWWAYKKHGVSIPRVTKDQAYAGSIAPLNRLQPGDILVFASSQAPNSLHTALYIGQDTFIHAPNSKSRVREDSLTNKYWRDNLALARRIV